jgi:hypothetical protein
MVLCFLKFVLYLSYRNEKNAKIQIENAELAIEQQNVLNSLLATSNLFNQFRIN